MRLHSISKNIKMKFKALKTKQLTPEELVKIWGGLAPDCDEGTYCQYIPGEDLVCVPIAGN